MKDKISEERIKKLHPAAQPVFRRFIEMCEDQLGITLRITQGLRTIDEQDALYAKGRTEPGPRVTNAKGGSSFHNYCLAVDLAVLEPGGSIDWDYNMALLKPIAASMGIEWGGDWKTIKDKPHFQWVQGHTVSGLLARVQAKQVDDQGYVLLTA